ncbi:hypothetical protein JCM8097_004478 [Rhodosporidiobolus ruineniae]
MSAPTAPMAFPALDNSIGAFEIGTTLSIFLSGVTVCQALEYYLAFGRTDRKWLVGMVSFLLVCDVFHTAISVATIYNWTVSHYGDLTALVKSPWMFSWDPFLCGVVAITVQCFYAWRVFVVSKRKWLLPAAIVVLAVLSCAFAIGSTVKIYLLNSEFARFGEFRYGVGIWLISAAVADVLITGSLIYYLKRASQGDHQRSANIVRRILTVTIECNGLTCLFAIADAVLFLAMPEQSWHVIPNLSLVKLYFNGVLVSLNVRSQLNQPTTNVSYSSPAPKYSSTAGSPNLITPATLGETYNAGAGANASSTNTGSVSSEKRGGFGLFGRSRPTSRDGGSSGKKSNAAQGVQVTTVQETITRGSSNGDTDDLEKGLDPKTAQAFELDTVSSRNAASDVSAGAPTVPHVYAIPLEHRPAAPVPPQPLPSQSQSQSQRLDQAESAKNNVFPVPVAGQPGAAPHSTGMAGAIPREWS